MVVKLIRRGHAKTFSLKADDPGLQLHVTLDLDIGAGLESFDDSKARQGHNINGLNTIQTLSEVWGFRRW